jgi:hypothetical protein
MSPVCSCFGLVIPPISICQSSPHRRCTQLQTDAAATHTTCVIWSALALFGNPSICIRRSFLHQYCVQVQIDAAATHTTWVVNLQLVACPTPCYSTAGSQLGLSPGLSLLDCCWQSHFLKEWQMSEAFSYVCLIFVCLFFQSCVWQCYVQCVKYFENMLYRGQGVTHWYGNISLKLRMH